MDTSNEKVHFFTIFVFPFKYEECKENTIAQPRKGSLQRVADVLTNGNTDAKIGWAECKYEIGPGAPLFQIKEGEKEDELLKRRRAWEEERIREYNQWLYFYPFVRKMIFRSHLSSEDDMMFLTREDFVTLCVQFVDGDSPPQHISVAVQSVDIHLFANQIGLLSITAESENQYTYDEFLRFNDLARRVYPPYLGFYKKDSNITSAPRKGSGILPNTITLVPKPREEKEEEDHHEQKEKMRKLLQQNFDAMTLPHTAPVLSDVLQQLLDPLRLKPWADLDKQTTYYEPFTDDRMFVVSFCAHPTLASQLSSKCCGRYDYETSSKWYAYIFVDGNGIGVKNESMKSDLIQKHTYARWIDNKTLFGMSRYSFVALSDDGFLYHHMKGVYYQIALIMLFQRAMLLEFSRRVKEIVDDVPRDGKTNWEKTVEGIKNLQLDFISFTTKYSFAEVTPQEQGIEIYTQWTKIMEVDELFNEVKIEIDQLAEHVQTRLSYQTDVTIKELTLMLSVLTWWLFILTVWLVVFGDFYLEGKLAEILGIAGKMTGDHLLPGFLNWILFGLAIVFATLPIVARISPLNRRLKKLFSPLTRSSSRFVLLKLFLKYVLGVEKSSDDHSR